jgi:hypothetical protein
VKERGGGSEKAREREMEREKQMDRKREIQSRSYRGMDKEHSYIFPLVRAMCNMC